LNNSSGFHAFDVESHSADDFSLSSWTRSVFWGSYSYQIRIHWNRCFCSNRTLYLISA
jgi:hypothetical protein